jgi:hypothetical protein
MTAVVRDADVDTSERTLGKAGHAAHNRHF